MISTSFLPLPARRGEGRGEGRNLPKALLSLLLLTACTSLPSNETFDGSRLRAVDAAIEQAIADKRIPGGVLHIERNGDVYGRVYGNRALEPDVEGMTAGTIFDAASITKVVATAPSVWMLIRDGKVSIDAPVQTYLPQYVDPAVTVRHLLTHTSGIRPSLSLREDWRGYDEGIRRALAERPLNRPGAVFRYSDVNYILLGDIVRRVSGMTLDHFARTRIFAPLKMTDTGFTPELSKRIAPTERVPSVPPLPAPRGEGRGEGRNLPDGLILRGVVHDPTSRRMGGVTGHAGLFTTASDLAKFARAVLQGDFFPREMTEVQTPAGVAIRRAGGFDIDSQYARPRGEHFPIGSFGHTGWTGGFLWIDPFSKTFYVFLSNRVHPDGKGSVVALQKQLGTLVAESIRGFDFANVPGALPKRPGGGVRWVIGGGDAMNGIDVLHASGYEALKGLRVGLITNHTGIDRTGNPTIDLLRSAPGVELAAIFSPEHGIRGELDQENLADDRDPVTGMTIFSLYGERRKPSAEQLANLDALVFDIQDVGARFYTYISTMGLAMEAAAELKKKFFVLDRVNPIGGDVVEGPVLEGETDFVGWHPIPVRHGKTVGELAEQFKKERSIDVDLTVIPVRGWKREQWQDEAGLPWINTSPNMRSLAAAGLYPGLGLMESAISVGRGTPTPFEILGAPYIDGAALICEVGPVAGVTMEPVRFTPNASIFKDQPCGGVRFTITDRRALRSVDLGLSIAAALRRLYGEKFEVEKMWRLLRNKEAMERVRRGENP